MWLQVLKEVQKRLRSVTEAVHLGFVHPQNIRIDARSQGVVYLIRDREYQDNNDLIPETIVSFYADLWTRSDAKDLSVGYEKIADLEDKVESVLMDIRDNVAYIDGNIRLLDLTITQKLGDLDSVRPDIGVRFEIDCRVCKEV